MMTRWLLLLLLAAPAWARPPAQAFMRMDELEYELAGLHDRLRKQELFAGKLRRERMIIRFGEGAESFEGKRLTDKGFVEEILVRWSEVQRNEADCNTEHVRILGLLPAALERRYNVVPIPKKARYDASKVLVKMLRSKHDILRKTAIDCLKGIYGTSLMYRPDATVGQRNERYRKWLKEIDKRRR